MKWSCKNIIIATTIVLLVVGIFSFGILALKYEVENYTYGCTRTETLLAYQAMSNRRGDVVSYSYTTANNTIYDSQKQFPLNTPVCVEEGYIPINK